MSLNKIGRNDRSIGNKAAGLSVLIKKNVPVPFGFVINSEACDLFLTKNEIDSKIRSSLEGINHNNYQKLKIASEEIKSTIKSASIPDVILKEIKDAYDELSISKEAKEVGGVALDFIRAGRGQTSVAVRPSLFSSPDSSFAGLSEPFLNVNGLSNLINSIKLCWAGLYTPRAVYYRKKRGFDDVSSMGVLIQKMINPEKSGNIITSINNHIVIEASWGFGHSINYGLVSPDRYILDRDTGEIIEKRIGKKPWTYKKDAISNRTGKEVTQREKINAQVLNEDEIEKLFGLIKIIEECFTNPQVIEWGNERGRFYIFQCEPFVTTEIEKQTEIGKLGENGFPLSPGVSRGRVKIINNTDDLDSIEEDDVIVTKVIPPILVPIIGKANGIISQYGGLTAKLPFICREFKIPCVSEIEIEKLREGQTVSVDGDNGIIYSIEATEEQKETPGIINEYIEDSDITGTKIMLSIDPSKLFNINNIDGIGLFKSEGLFFGKNPLLTAKENPEQIIETVVKLSDIAEKINPKMLWYRIFAPTADEMGEVEKNPIIGFRGIRRALEEIEMLKCEIEGLKKLYSIGVRNVGVLIPFISDLEELKRAKDMMPFSLKLGIEIATPSSALNIEEFCKEGINSVLINMDELSQLTLGADYSNKRVSETYSLSNSSVMKLIGNVVKTCKNYNIDVSVYIKRYSMVLLENLIKLGIDSITAEPNMIDDMKKDISRIERKIILDRSRDNRSYGA